MRFGALVRKVLAVYDRYARDNAIKVDEDYAILKLVEEVGEFAQAVIIQRGKSRASKRIPAREAQQAVANELADILGLTILVAHRIGVDLQAAIRKKWLKFLDGGTAKRPAARARGGSGRKVGGRPADAPSTRRAGRRASGAPSSRSVRESAPGQYLKA